MGEISGAVAGGPAPAAPAQSAPARKGKDLGGELEAACAPKIKAWREAATALNIAQVTKATEQYISLIAMQVTLIRMMAKFKKPANIQFIKEPFKTLQADMQNVKDKDFKAPPNHIKTVLDGIDCMFWYMAAGQDELVDNLKENHANIYFFGNKILKEKKEKDDNWVNAYTDLATTFKDFIEPKAGNILDWTGTEADSGAKAYFEAEFKKVATTTTAAPQEEEKKQVPVPKPAAAAAGAKKPKVPIKQKVINKWTIENYTEPETLRFEGEQEVNTRVNFNVFNCKNITIEIVGKCQNVMISKCEKITLIVDKIISQIEV